MRVVIISGDKAEVMEIKPGLKEKRRIVQGNIECISLDVNFTLQMFINEEGKIKNFRHNDIATKVYRAYIKTQDWIAGDVVICGCNLAGDCCDLTDEQIGKIMKIIGEE